MNFKYYFLLIASSIFIQVKDVKAEFKESYFEGTIHYKMNYTTLNGSSINQKIAAFFDKEQYWYIDEHNYKVLNQDHQHLKLYQSMNNSYYFFNRDNTAYKIDQTSKTTQQVRVISVEDSDTILGYPCKAIKIQSDFVAYIYFFNPAIKVDITPYQNYNMAEWNVYLKASNGALPLRVITMDIRSKFIEDKQAVVVTPKELSATEFEFPSTVKLKKLKYGLDMVW